MATTDLSNYKALYLQTAKEYAANLSAGCESLEKNILDKDALNQLHISSHSLKSQSQVMGHADIANICLNIEKISKDAMDGIVGLTDEIITNIKKSVEELGLLLKELDAKTSSA